MVGEKHTQSQFTNTNANANTNTITITITITQEVLIMAMAMSLGMGMGVPKRSGCSSRRRQKARAWGVRCSLKAVIFDCDGVILESEHLHRQAYNEAFAHFKVGCEWSPEFYDDLQNRIGGGKPKMRWYFSTFGWPCESEEERGKLIDTLQDWKTERYKAILSSGTVSPRPGVLPLMDHAKAAGFKLAVCSAATKTSVILCLQNLIGLERFQALDCFLAGDDVKLKKPDPSIYLEASRRLGVSGKDCIVIEDSVIGLQAATGAGMPCVITYTSSTADQDFKDAIAVYPDLSNVSLTQLDQLLQKQAAK